MNEEQYWTTCTAGLLYSLRKTFDQDCIKAIPSCNFLGKSLFEALINNDIGNNKENILLSKIIAMANTFSEAKGYTENSMGNINNKDYKLQNIFSHIELHNDIGNSNKGYELSPFKPELIFPKDKDRLTSEITIDDLMQKFIVEFHEQFRVCKIPDELFRKIYLLINKYLWCIPANPDDGITDISLFDHMSVTSAIVACLYKYHAIDDRFDEDLLNCDNKPRFLLVAGDISGIQKYIIGGGKQSPNGLVRRLRARSFIVSAITNLASFSIIQACGLPQSCILHNTGGNFLLLLPNTPHYADKLSEISRKIDVQLFEKFKGDLQINIASTHIKGVDFKMFGHEIDSVKIKLAAQKNMPMKSILMEQGSWHEEEFIIHNDVQNHGLGICTGCYKEYADQISDDEKMGPRCREETSIGSKLPVQSSFSLIENNKEFISAGNFALSTDLSKGIRISIKNSSDELNFLWPIGTYIPTIDGQLLTFEEIAEKSNGLLGWLKADVDNLRALFSLGLQYENGSRFDSASRIATISRMMDAFFSQWLPEYISKKFSNCYMVYAGGDDLLIVGPWDDIIGLAGALHVNFIDFTGGHPSITISAGVAITHPRLPISRAFSLVDDALESSKSGGKDRITLFGKTVKWDYMPDIIKECLRLKEWHLNKMISSSDLYKFKHFSKMFEKFELDGSVEQLSFAGMLSWEIGKKIQENSRLDPKVIEWMESLLDVGPNAVIRNLEIACDFALLSNRRRGPNE